MSTHTGTWIQRINSWYCSTVIALIIHNSNAEMTAAATALQENSKYARFSRCLNQTAP